MHRLSRDTTPPTGPRGDTQRQRPDDRREPSTPMSALRPQELPRPRNAAMPHWQPANNVPLPDAAFEPPRFPLQFAPPYRPAPGMFAGPDEPRGDMPAGTAMLMGPPAQKRHVDREWGDGRDHGRDGRGFPRPEGRDFPPFRRRPLAQQLTQQYDGASRRPLPPADPTVFDPPPQPPAWPVDRPPPMQGPVFVRGPVPQGGVMPQNLVPPDRRQLVPDARATPYRSPMRGRGPASQPFNAPPGRHSQPLQVRSELGPSIAWPAAAGHSGYSEERLVETSKFMSYVLRHGPESIGLQQDREGWVSVDALVANAPRWRNMTRDLLLTVVETSDKTRFALSDDETRIRANQGHSVEGVDLNLPPQQPPDVLYHGTAEHFAQSIWLGGLEKRKRHHVHLSTSLEVARSVGARHGQPVVFEVDAARMHADGCQFFRSANGVWLTNGVPSEYLKELR